MQIVGWEPPTNGVQLFTPSLSPTSSLLTFCFLCRPPLRLAPHHAGLRQPLRWLSAVLDFDTIRHLPADATHAAAAAVTARSTLTLTLHLGERDGVQVRARITAPPALECAGEGFGATHAQCSSDNGEMYRLYCRRAWCVVLKSHECWWDAAIPWTALSGASREWPSFARPNVNHSMSNTISTAGIGCTCNSFCHGRLETSWILHAGKNSPPFNHSYFGVRSRGPLKVRRHPNNFTINHFDQLTLNDKTVVSR